MADIESSATPTRYRKKSPAEFSPFTVGLVIMLVVVLGASLLDLIQDSLLRNAEPAVRRWITTILVAIAAAVLAAFAAKKSDRLTAHVQTETAERERLEGELKHVLSSVRCLLWYATVEEVNGEYLWDTRVSHEEAARRILPAEVPPGMQYADSWYRSKLPEDSIRADQSSINAFRTGAPRYSNEYRCQLESGEIRWFYEDVLVEQLDEKHFYVIGVCMDVNDIKVAEEKLDQERVMLRTLIDNLPDMVYIKDTDSRFVLNNIAHRKQLRAANQAELTGKTDFDVFNKEIAQPFFDDEQEIIRTGKSILTRTERSLDGNGNEVWFWSSKVPLRDSQGRIIGIVGVSRDITDRKQEETDLKGALQEVEEARKMAEHHAHLLELQTKELEEARDQALASTRAKSEFLANMSHEIRTPMNGILGITDLLTGTTLTNEQRDFSETIRTSANALLTVINDILDFSRIEAGKMQIEVVDFNLRTLMEEVTDLVAGNAFGKGLELNCYFPLEMPERLKGDPARLRQILTNLVGNAVKFTDKGEVTIEAHLIRQTDVDATIRLSVVDSGIGIPKPAQARIFESFTQADGTTTRKYGGTGLGLTICKHLTELMGGQIGMVSVDGEGSTFFLELTLQKQTGAEEPELPPAPVIMCGLRVLIVDDNATNRKVLCEQLANWGCEPEDAATGEEALERLDRAAVEGRPLQVAIIDMHMPAIDGEETARRIRHDDRFDNLLLILYTSIGEKSTSQYAREAGFQAVLTKPARQSQLFNVMLSVLGDAAHQNGVMGTPADATEPLNLNILLAEDNEINQLVATMMLERFGCKTVIVETGKLALEAMNKSDFDVVLMDVHMPEMDGYEATGEIRKREGFTGGHTPVIAMTAKAMPGDRELGLSAGMDDYIVKPVRPDDLYAMLKKWGHAE